MSDYAKVLRRTGVMLLVVGAVDIGWMVYCIANGISYSSSFNIFAVIAGVFLMRGSLRTASLVRWFAAFLLGAVLSMCVAWPFIQPVNLVLTEVRLHPGSALETVAFAVAVVGFLFWLCSQLGSASVIAASAAAGVSARNMRTAVATGVGLVVLITCVLSVALGGESARKATALAAQQVGPGYRFHVQSLNTHTTQRRTWVDAVVTAWTDAEVRDLSVHWEE